MNKISHRSLASLGAATALLVLGACTKLADKNYMEIVTTQFNPTNQDVPSLVGAAYVNWRGLIVGWNGLFRLSEASSDEMVIPARPNGWVDDGSYRRLHEHKWTPQDGCPASTWASAYGGITNCNRLLFQINAGQIPIATGKDELLAELRVLRASYYYILCDLFGNVPIVDRFDVPAGFVPQQSTRAQVYAFVVKEITEALPLLSTSADKTTYGRFNNQGAANALLAKVYLNAQVYTGQADWAKCIAACDAVINSGKYQLEPVQKNVFKTQNESSTEIIFAIPFDELYAPGFTLQMETLQPQNQQTYSSQSSMWGGICAVPQFIQSYDSDDNRLKANWIQGQQYSSSGVPLQGSFGAYKGQPLIYTNTLPGVDNSAEVDGFRMGNFEYRQGMRTSLSNDWPLLRYADVLLTKAEALLRTNQAAAAAALVTQVRQRSFGATPGKAVVTAADLTKGSSYPYGPARNNVISPVQGGSDVAYGRMLDELGWEFAAEAHRRQDMIRFGVYTTKSWLSHVPNGTYRALMPIPQSALNTNPNLVQNPGY